MTPQVLLDKFITITHLGMAGQVERFLQTLPNGLNCHQVVAKIVEEWPDKFDAIKGRFNNFDHSWLIFKDDPFVILDPYPWASASGPLLIRSDAIMWGTLYVEEQEWRFRNKQVC